MSTVICDTMSVDEAKAMEGRLPPGLYELRLYMLSPLSLQELNGLHTHLLDSGVDVRGAIVQSLAKDEQGLWRIAIKYQKHAVSAGAVGFYLAIGLLPLAILAVVVSLVLIKLPRIINSITILAVVVGGVWIASKVLSRPQRARA